ncbi:MAG: phosphate ABC transporter substrate-binding protein PstS [Ignavibacteria bacterium]|nr:phosphate ABC transporter substrate-binding protein PstS [Ignavibacteria bacterium]
MKKLTFLLLIALVSIMFFSCGKKSSIVQLNGAGATFPYPLYSKWFDEYSKVHKEAKINYQSIGSGGGIKQLTEGTVDFGATDSPMTEEEQKEAESKNKTKIFHIPAALGAVVLTYNIPELDKPLNLKGKVAVDIFLGKIKKWNAPEIAEDNPNTKLPDKEIVVVHRTDGSGTTYILTDYFAKISEEWKNNVGVSKTVKFPTGQGAKGNEGVSGSVKQIPYSIGYVELIYAIQNKLQYANIQNENGEFVTPNLDAVTNAGRAMLNEMSENLTVSLVNAKGSGVYPISSYTYLLVLEKYPDPEKAKILSDFLKWALTEGQKFAKELGYSPIPQEVYQKAIEKINKIH